MSSQMAQKRKCNFSEVAPSKTMRMNTSRKRQPLRPVYQPLESTRCIRLLKVGATDSGRFLSYALEVTTIDKAKDDYHALSYAWGPPGRERTVIINGQRIRVRRSLFTFLQRLNARRWEGSLWIDAVCIDQSEVKERNHQVQMMHDIYAAARQVFVWLGDSSPQIDRLFDNSADGKGLQLDRFLGGLNHADLEAILQIIRMPYWNRIWIVQELARAKEVVLICGDNHIEFAKLKRLVGLNKQAANIFYDIRFEIDLVHEPYWQLRDMSQWRFICGMFWDYHADTTLLSTSLLDLIYSFGHMDCLNKHDRVYALLGLLDHQSRALLSLYFEVDYGRSMSELFDLTLEYCRGNNEETDASAILDLILFLKLRHYRLGTDGFNEVTASERFIGTIDAKTGQEKNPLSTLLPEDLLDLNDVDDWVRGEGLRWHDTLSGERALIDSSSLRPQDLMYQFSPQLESLNIGLRPAAHDALVIVVRFGADHQARLLTVGLLPWSKLVYEDTIFVDNEYDLEKLRLLKWREIVEVFLREAQLEISISGRRLAISSTLSRWITFSEALLQEALEWDEDHSFFETLR